jgi:hypothetical protein
VENKPATTYKALLAGRGDVARLPGSDGLSALVARGLLVLTGAALLAASAYAVFALLPASLGPEPGSERAVTESVEYWTPEEGHETVLRPRTDAVHEGSGGLELVRTFAGPHSPRGGEFRVGLDQGWRLAEEPSAHAAFPATPPWEKPPETVYVGVPWQTDRGLQLALFDDFRRLHEVEDHGLDLVKYKADEPSQFLVDDDVAWFRSVQRTALVEPISGTVVDYREEETIWRTSLEGPELLRDVRPPSDQREKVWEATIEPTPAGTQRLAEHAEEARADELRELAAYALPAVLASEALMAAGLVGWPKRWLAAGD